MYPHLLCVAKDMYQVLSPTEFRGENVKTTPVASNIKVILLVFVLLLCFFSEYFQSVLANYLVSTHTFGC